MPEDEDDDIPLPISTQSVRPWDLSLLRHWCRFCAHASGPTGDGVHWCEHREACRAGTMTPAMYRRKGS